MTTILYGFLSLFCFILGLLFLGYINNHDVNEVVPLFLFLGIGGLLVGIFLVVKMLTGE